MPFTTISSEWEDDFLGHEPHIDRDMPARGQSDVLQSYVVRLAVELKSQLRESIEPCDRVPRRRRRPRLPTRVLRRDVGGPTAEVQVLLVIVFDVEVAGVGLESLELLYSLHE
jgi:hypothetical protein